jgi:hypothetical protein
MGVAMTVRELIEALQKLPQDLPVWSYDNDLEPVHAPVVLVSHDREYPGWFPERITIKGETYAR